ncbi:hypothetical protein FSP39_014979 [Pinctada imbricata]|uniref:Uncharacterized protein n=1 Tax=Pinctada imbricata TaxID=66713 RepID=A0AA89BXE2_PINIB|nr:hypothetical protein FSP39_014979 [Pinctada imbricata]
MFTAPRNGAYVFTWTAVTQEKYMINLLLVVKGKVVSLAQGDGGANGSQNRAGTRR